ncbi:dehydrogenase [Kitasatospora putterlickiae]|uniref:Dehydrogenase n=1 Tax=Kitasatospora putterlickiae TaxID=221725 RepID=A0ABN1XNM9_9ACTN
MAGSVPGVPSDQNAPACPTCDQPLTGLAMALFKRDDDGERTCRAVWGCALGHVWWQWADRARLPLEPCPRPDLFT